MPWTPSKKRSWKNMSGKGKGSGGPPKKKSLTATVTALAKIVKKDHKMVAKSVDYTDYQFPETIAIVSYKVWGYTSLMQPNLWTSTCRRSNSTTISPETQLKNLTISICCNHGTSNYETSWFVAVVRPKKDWTPDLTSLVPILRGGVDFTDMGAGNAPILNYDKFVVLKSWSVTTNYVSQGEPSQSTKRLVRNFRLNQTIRGSAQTVGSADQNWLGNTDSDFTNTDKLYVIYYGNTPQNAAWGALYNPSITIGARFTCATL